MARRSAVDLATRRRAAPRPAAPEPPEGMSLPEQRLWRAITGAKPAGWFDAGAVPVLAEYVRAACSCDRLASEIQKAPALRLGSLMAARDKESRRLAALGSKLRVLPVSRYRPDHAAHNRPPVGDRRPWEAP